MNRIRSVSLILAYVLTQACSTETMPTDPIEPQPTSGSLEVTIEETGPRPDIDGYDVAITLATQAGPVVRPVQQGGGSLVLADLPLGTHLLRIEGLAPHCSVTGRHPRAFTVEAGTTVQIALGVFCPGPGAVLVKTVTRGRDVAPEYRLSIAGESAMESSIGLNDSLLIAEEDLPEGTLWFVELTGVPANCWMDRQPKMAVRNLQGTTVRIEYAVVCIPRPTRIAYQFPGGGRIYLTGGAEAVSLTDHISWSGPSLSPNRSRVAYSSDPFLDGIDLYVVNADGSGSRRITSDGAGNFVGSQAWSPDGSRIVFWKTNDSTDSTSDIYVVNADGSGEVRLTFGGSNTHPAWSPDGTSIAFCRTVGDPFENSLDVYRMSAVDGSGLTRVAESGCEPAWSPDGSKIAFAYYFSDYSGGFVINLAVIGVDGSGLTWLPAGVGRSPSWSPDGSQIAYSGGQFANRIWIVDFEGNAFGEPFPFRFGRAPSWR